MPCWRAAELAGEPRRIRLAGRRGRARLARRRPGRRSQLGEAVEIPGTGPLRRVVGGEAGRRLLWSPRWPHAGRDAQRRVFDDARLPAAVAVGIPGQRVRLRAQRNAGIGGSCSPPRSAPRDADSSGRLAPASVVPFYRRAGSAGQT